MHQVKDKTRDRGGPATVETEVNRDSKRTNERGSFIVGLLCVSAGTSDFSSAVAALVGPVENISWLL